MDAKWVPVIVAGVMFLIIFGGGYWLGKKGKPYNQALLAVHKLVSLGALVYLCIVFVNYGKVEPFTGGQVAALAVAGFFFVATIVNGALVSLKKEMPMVVKIMHKINPYLTVASTAIAFYLFLV